MVSSRSAKSSSSSEIYFLERRLLVLGALYPTLFVAGPPYELGIETQACAEGRRAVIG